MFENKNRGVLSFKNRLIGLISLDIFLLCFSLWLSIALRYGDLNKDMSPFWWQFPLVCVAGVFVFSKLGLYRVVSLYIGFSILRPVMGGRTRFSVDSISERILFRSNLFSSFGSNYLLVYRGFTAVWRTNFWCKLCDPFVLSSGKS